VNFALKGSLVELLPAFLRNLLLPQMPRLPAQSRPSPLETFPVPAPGPHPAWRGIAAGSDDNKGLHGGVPRVRFATRPTSGFGAAEPTCSVPPPTSVVDHASLSRWLRAKEAAKSKKIAEPELTGVIVRSFTLGPTLWSWCPIVLSGMKNAAAVCALSFGASAALLATGWAKGVLRRGLELTGSLTTTTRNECEVDARVDKVTKVATAVGLLSAGAAVVVTAYAHRLSVQWEACPLGMAPVGPSRRPCEEPESEVSPEPSEGTAQDQEHLE
jgi:hypothetical protein